MFFSRVLRGAVSSAGPIQRRVQESHDVPHVAFVQGGPGAPAFPSALVHLRPVLPQRGGQRDGRDGPSVAAQSRTVVRSFALAAVTSGASALAEQRLSRNGGARRVEVVQAGE